MRYLLDSNTFIEAKNRYYHPTFCPAYWDWLLQKNDTSILSSISFVFDELEKGNDDLAEWVKNNKQFFMDIDDDDTQTAYQEIVDYTNQNQAHMKPNAMSDFLSGADPWLIAKAMTTNSAIVTHEKKDPYNKKKFLIPVVAEHFGIDSMNTFELLSKEQALFVLPATS